MLLHNMGIKDVVVTGIFTDQCVSSSVRSLVDESFGVVEDCCAAATLELHHHELEIISMIYCHVVQSDEALGFFTSRSAAAASPRSRPRSRRTRGPRHHP